MGSYEIRAAGRFVDTAKRLASAAATVDPSVVLKCDPLSNANYNVVHRNRAMGLIATIFGLFAGLLAMIGVYGVTSYTTAERTREIGIRMALGAQHGDVLWLVVGQGARMAFAGVAIGLLGAFVVTRLMTGMVYGVSTTDPASFLGAAVGLMLIGLGASYLPALRASRVDPMIALRYE